MRIKFIEVAGVALTALVLVGSAYADVIFTQGNDSMSTTNIVVPSGPTGGAPLGAPINGEISSVGHGIVAVKLTSDSDRLIGTSGAGNICAESCSPIRVMLHNVTLQLPEFAFTHISLNPNGPLGDLTFTVFTCRLINNGTCVEEAEPFTRTFGPQPGQNRVNITSNAFSSCGAVPGCVPGNEMITSVTLDVPAGFQSLNQIRLSNGALDIANVEVVPIPEPSSMLLVGSGLMVFTQVLRRKLKHGFGTRSA